MNMSSSVIFSTHALEAFTGTIVNNVTNTTTKPPFKPPPGLQLAYNILVPSILGVIMLSMGCAITVSEILKHLKRPVGVIIGAVSQFILLPLAAFGMAHAFRLNSYQAIGMLIVSCCPGGAVSNIFTFWSRGNVTLSIVMTTMSTILALGLMPLNLFIYTRSWTNKGVVVPYGTIALGLLLILVPVAIGALINYRWKKVANILLRVGSLFGILLIIIAGILQRYLYPQIFDLKWTIWIAAFLLPIVGFGLGFALSSIFCQPFSYRRTISFETGCQNVGLALSLIALSFKSAEANKFTQFPIIFAVFMMVDNFVIVFIHRVYFRMIDRKKKEYKFSEDNEEIIEKKDQELKETNIDSKKISNENLKVFVVENGSLHNQNKRELSMLY